METAPLWMLAQKRAFYGWANAYLNHNSAELRAIELKRPGDLSDGTILIRLLEAVERRKLQIFKSKHRQPRSMFDSTESVKFVLDYLRSVDKRSIPIDLGADDIVKNCSLKTSLTVLWRFIIQYGIQIFEDEESSSLHVEHKQKMQVFQKSPENQLKTWVNSVLPQGLQVRNFKSDFQDGVVLTYLLNMLFKEEDRISEDDMKTLDSDELLDGVMKMADEKLGIPILLDTEQHMRSPVKQAVMAYVAVIRSSKATLDRVGSQQTDAIDKVKKAHKFMQDSLRVQLSSAEERLGERDNVIASLQKDIERTKSVSEEKEKESAAQISELKKRIDSLMAENASIQTRAAKKSSEHVAKESELTCKVSVLTANLDETNKRLKVAEENMALSDRTTALQLLLEESKEQLIVLREDLEAKFAAEKSRYVLLFEEVKARLSKSNHAGQNLRTECQRLTRQLEMQSSELMSLRDVLSSRNIRIKELEAAMKEKENVVLTQEACFRLQLEEMNEFIAEMRGREKNLMKTVEELSVKPPPPPQAAVAKRDGHREKVRSHPLHRYEKKEELVRDSMVRHSQSLRESHHGPRPKVDEFSAPMVSMHMDYEKTVEQTNTRFGKTKWKTTWRFLGLDNGRNEVILLLSDPGKRAGKSKRIITVNGREEYNEKSDMTSFACKIGMGQDAMRIRLAILSNTKFELYLNEKRFEDIRNDYYIKKSRSYSRT